MSFNRLAHPPHLYAAFNHLGHPFWSQNLNSAPPSVFELLPTHQFTEHVPHYTAVLIERLRITSWQTEDRISHVPLEIVPECLTLPSQEELWDFEGMVNSASLILRVHLDHPVGYGGLTIFCRRKGS